MTSVICCGKNCKVLRFTTWF